MKTNPADTIHDHKASLMQVDPVEMRLAVVRDARRALTAGIVYDGIRHPQILLEARKELWLAVCDQAERQLTNPTALPPVLNRWHVIEELARRWVLHCS